MQNTIIYQYYLRGEGSNRVGVLCESKLPKDDSCIEYCTSFADCRSVKCDETLDMDLFADWNAAFLDPKIHCCCSVRHNEDEPCGGDKMEGNDGLKRMMWRLLPSSNGPGFWQFTGGLSLGDGSPLNEYYLTYISDDHYQRGIKMAGSWQFSYDLVRIIDQKGQKTKYWEEFEKYWTNSWWWGIKWGKKRMYTYESNLMLNQTYRL